jgi:hypothetical protein
VDPIGLHPPLYKLKKKLYYGRDEIRKDREMKEERNENIRYKNWEEKDEEGKV